MHVQSLYGNLNVPQPKKTPRFLELAVDFWTYQDPYDALHAFFCAERFQQSEGIVLRETLLENYEN